MSQTTKKHYVRRVAEGKIDIGGNPIFDLVENVNTKIISMFEKEEEKAFEDNKGADVKVKAPPSKEVM
jgi:hypothetical protein